ncbi:protein POOR HOMOLOGOUS SYNAPSIS 1-like isoform X2 [Magnolia sinica]|uniref:protein POOR HOMOLOGOUS SYNAPSIS 1-like isoform X2 n=1 Tax=Magnolia sinica TaxID=86752 RepID=UPI002658AF2A|nr:protein POOR HOMOLOGOUS SYNAPSIS 1-like isoform X2 [Magnolia sinica]
MAGALTVKLGGNPDASLKDQWEVDFSRFFENPRISLSFSSLNLKPGKNRSGGTWISSSSAALLHLLPKPPAILTVSIRGKIPEEHFVSNLRFSWPQVSCGAHCPVRGSRVVFASYRDCDSQIQKFALRFSVPREAQTFLDAVKETSKNILEIGYPRDDTGYENSTQLEYIALPEYRAEELGFTNANASYHPEMPVLNFQGEQHICSQQPVLTNNFDSVLSSLPPSFATLLTSCSVEKLKEAPEPMETDFMSQIMRYLSDSSFHDMVAKVEKVIGDLGGNLLL